MARSVAELVVVLLSRRYRHRQPVFFRRQGAGGIRSYRAGRIVRAVEVQYDGSVHYRLGFQKPPARVGLGLAGRVIEDKKQSLGRIAAQITKPQFLAIDREYYRSRHRRRG